MHECGSPGPQNASERGINQQHERESKGDDEQMKKNLLEDTAF